MHECQQCTKQFTRRTTLERHLRTSKAHVADGSYTCQDCKLLFTRPDLLDRHVRIHTGKGLEQCAHCHRGFHRGYLRRHEPSCRMRFRTISKSAPTAQSGLPVSSVDVRWQESKTVPLSGFRGTRDPSRPVQFLCPTTSLASSRLGRHQRQLVFELLQSAIRHGDLTQVKSTMSALPPGCRSIDYLDDLFAEYNALSPHQKDQWTIPRNLACCAVRWGQVDVLKFLVKCGADIIRNEEVLLQWAARHDHISMMEYLLEYDVALDSIKPGHTALAVAADYGKFNAARLLVERGADVNAMGQGRSPLNCALIREYRNITKLLIDHGAHLLPVSNQAAPMITAARWGRIDTLALLMEVTTEVDAADNRDRTTALCGAALGGQVEAAKLLIDAAASVDGILGSYGTTPLIEACREDWAGDDMLELLIEGGANVNVCRPLYLDAQGRLGEQTYTALSAACWIVFATSEIRSLRTRRVQRLLDVGADPNLGDPTPLNRALESGNPDLARILVQAGASTDQVTEHYEKVLIYLTDDEAIADSEAEP